MIQGSTVLKNVERQRFKKQSEMGSGGRSSAPGYYPENDRHSSNAFYPDRRAVTLSNRTWQEPSGLSVSVWLAVIPTEDFKGMILKTSVDDLS
ncbi:unnamed protein product [Strongylus vulgaris]|uniref:Uncharacterized protein n=1 Tax=Strongylus vulgaris TaxID=40348 RepID=A0A3P7JF34_STRVU|nr:unnamed protein product [Strongylus vulgaris]